MSLAFFSHNQCNLITKAALAIRHVKQTDTNTKREREREILIESVKLSQDLRLVKGSAPLLALSALLSFRISAFL